MVMKANQISNYIISLAQNNPEENLTNMKLQKILYYLQGYHLALFNEVLFEEEIEAWKYGPVISKEYYTFKVYGNNSINVPETNHSFDYLSDKQKKFINKVYGYFRQFSPVKMMELTHEESPWLDTYGKSQVIDNELLKDEKKERKEAARFLLIDYLYDNELIDSSISDAEDIYEY
jgi:uncharacterized phage-associated protein